MKKQIEADQMENNINNQKPRRFHYAYLFEGAFASITLGFCAIIALLNNPNHMFIAWYAFLILGGIVDFFLKRRLEKDISKHFGDVKMRLIYTIGVYWFEGGLFMATIAGTLFYIVLKATGKI
jgi:hypothetical protein